MLDLKVVRSAACAASRCMVWSAMAALSACGPLRPRMPEPDPALAAAAARAEATAAEVRERSAVPTAVALADRVVLYTEMLEDLDLIRESSGGQTARAKSLSELRRLALERDTIRGDILVHQWLVRRREEGGDSVPFSLRTEQVFQCDGAVLQYGRYRLPRRKAELVRMARRHPVEIAWEVPFVARWSDPADGPMEMEALWMGPLNREVTPVRLADNCIDTEEPAFTQAYVRRRWAVEAAGGYTLQQGAPGVVEDAVTEQGWIGDLTNTASYWAELGVFWRIRPGWQIEGLGSYQAPGTVKNHRVPLYDATLRSTAVAVGGLLLAELGPVRVGAGPTVSFARWRWSDTDVTQPSTSTTATLPGGLVEVGYVQNFHSHVYLHLRARYGFFPDAETPGFRDLGPVTVPMSGARVSAGVGYWW